MKEKGNYSISDFKDWIYMIFDDKMLFVKHFPLDLTENGFYI